MYEKDGEKYLAADNELAELMALAQTGKVTLHTRTYPLADDADALADLDAGRALGRAILVP
ncbi:MAG: zinc-binding dehydrogenase [Streptosporangiaceae bacterium]